MPRRAKEENGRILHPDYDYAYIKIRDTHYHTVVHDIARSTGIRADKTDPKSSAKALRQAMFKLEERVEDYKLSKKHPEQIVTPKYESQNNKNIVELASEYIRIRKHMNSVSEVTLRHLVSHFRVYFVENFSIEQTTEIRTMIVSIANNKNYSEATMKKHYKRLHAFFDWCIKAGYCTINPMAAVPLPHVPQNEIVFPTWEEFYSIIEYYKKGAYYNRFNHERDENIRFWRLLAMSGMRVGEAIKMKVEDIQAGGFSIDGKRQRHNEKKIRWFPTEIIPGMEELIVECVKNAQSDGRLWSWSYYQTPSLKWRNCIRDLKMDNNYTMHSLRRLAKWWWEVELGIPPHIANMLAGHSFAVRTKYHRTSTLDDLKQYIRTSGMRQE